MIVTSADAMTSENLEGHMTRARSVGSPGVAERFASAIATLSLTLMLVPAVAAPPSGSAANGDTRLESMQIEIWPEYDRPAALVILRGELAGNVALPAVVSLRIPASSGGPAAVAFATEKSGKLLNLAHDRSDAADFIVLRFTVPARFFHVEFYDRLATDIGERSYKYLWPGDLPVSWLDVVLQEPAGASNISVKPELVESASGADGLRYRSAQLGPAERGKPLPIEIRYSKTDPRTSAQILNLSAPAPLPQAGSAPLAAPLPGPKEPSWFFPALGATALLVAAAASAFVLWWRRRRHVGPAARAGYCSKCRNEVVAGDRFCSKCGAPLK
ncbi:MAG: hypothetical protein A2V92_00085 [Candidatus Muproteobacteria bacterium RBG_16_65_31]|uniref:Zinc-ribbon domain-containing protein n=1 Tax=Candidatus Muproteobacteria bacterium RBG_16_65_31 TaxID=1817759 RepID=A0A1F6TCJ7_9PROT|nr:MAG: hypothetical protein A2V92_00085 [Candidatus Muproteobacteria bacterium RBG_16_65_31]